MFPPPIPFILRWWKPMLALAVAVGLWTHGNVTGRSACEARHEAAMVKAQRDLWRAAEQASREEAARLEAEAAREDLARQLEDAAYAEPPSADCGLPASRVLRLKER